MNEFIVGISCTAEWHCQLLYHELHYVADECSVYVDNMGSTVQQFT
jgi:hypothetical protein